VKLWDQPVQKSADDVYEDVVVAVTVVVVVLVVEAKHRFTQFVHVFAFAKGTCSKYTVQINLLYRLKP
jgi:hypothetical protein